jgi:hypothetical protein
MKKLVLIVLFVFFTLLLVACESGNSAQGGNWENYQNEALGISFKHPKTWVVQEIDGGIRLAFDQETLDNDFTTGAGATIMLATVSDFEGLTELSDILNLYMEYMEIGRDSIERISEPEFITIQDQPAGIVSYRGTIPKQTGLFTLVTIMNQDQIVLVMAFDGSEDEQHQETLEQIVQSISVYSPRR